MSYLKLPQLPSVSVCESTFFVTKQFAFQKSVGYRSTRRLIDGKSIDISLGGIHNIVVGSDIDKTFQESVSVENLSGFAIDSTGVKQHKGRKEELRNVIGITKRGRVKPLGCFANTAWPEIECTIKKRIKQSESGNIPFSYDGEPGLGGFLAEVAETQRCTWHGSRGLYHALWEDGLKKKASRKKIRSGS